MIEFSNMPGLSFFSQNTYIFPLLLVHQYVLSPQNNLISTL